MPWRRKPVFTQMLLNLDDEAVFPSTRPVSRLSDRQRKPPLPKAEWTNVTKANLSTQSELTMAIPAVIKPKFFAVPFRGLDLDEPKPNAIVATADEDCSGSDDDDSSRYQLPRDDQLICLDDLTHAYNHFKRSTEERFVQCIIDKCSLTQWLNFFLDDDDHHSRRIQQGFDRWIGTHGLDVTEILRQTLIPASPDVFHFIHSVSAACACREIDLIC